MQQIPAVLWATDRRARFSSVVGAGLEQLGLQGDSLVGQDVREYFAGEVDASPASATEAALRGRSASFEFEWKGRSFACKVEPLRSPDGHIEGTLALAADITERKILETQLTYRAFHDPLTGLANRALFRDRVTHALHHVTRGERVAVAFLDLDDFKTVNDSFGHDEGDRLLQTVAARLAGAVRGHDTVARLGGDEFAILFERLDQDAEAMEILQRVEAVLQPPVTLHGRPMRVGASVGLAHAAPGETADDLLRNADLAMYRAKESDAPRLAVFEPRMHADVVARLELEADLRLAVERGELTLAYQPVIALNGGEIQGFEALVRWTHPVRGVLAPLDFIPLAEESGLIVELGRWVIEEACRQLRAWHDLAAAGAVGMTRDLRMGINVSGHQIRSDAFCSHAKGALEASGVIADRVVLEITEGTLMARTEDTLARLHALKRLGIQLAIDDFGTGYSSLSYLQRFPIDVMKIDKSFVDGVTANGSDTALTRTILTLGEMLHLRTLAEGVETAEQCEALRELGCRFAQGFYFASPMPARDVIPWAREHSAGYGARQRDAATRRRALATHR